MYTIDQCTKCNDKLWSKENISIFSTDLSNEFATMVPEGHASYCRASYKENVNFQDGEKGKFTIPSKPKAKSNKLIDAQESLDAFFAPSLMEEYYCNFCKETSDCIQEYYIKEPQDYIIIYLKRFDLSTYRPTKNNTKIVNNMSIDLSNYVLKKTDDIKDYHYSLYGVVEHHGSLEFGHYVAYVKYEDDKNYTWYEANDSWVNETKEEDVKDSQGFLLFYKRMSLEEQSTMKEVETKYSELKRKYCKYNSQIGRAHV